MTTVPPELWVRLITNNSAVVSNAALVPTKDCNDVDNFTKAVKKELPNQLKDFDASVLSLHLTENSTALEPNVLLSDLTAQEGYVHNAYETPLYVKTTTIGPPAQVSIHSILDWEEVEFRPLTYDATSSYFELDQNYFAETGLPVPVSKKLLYCRSAFRDQINFLQNRVLDKEVCGWILGPPGTGKSTTAFAFACTLDPTEWIVTWIHISKLSPICCVRLENGRKKSCFLGSAILLNLGDFLNNVDPTKKHFVIVDGYAQHTHQGEQQRNLLDSCNFWLSFDRKKRPMKRLLYVCCMTGRYKANYDDDIVFKAEEHFVFSWHFSEYLEAVKSDEFFDNVKECLDADDSGVDAADIDKNIYENRIKLVKSKYYFAGGSCRYMFQLNTSTVIERINVSLLSVTNIREYAAGSEIGSRSEGVINRLFNCFPETPTICTIVSPYAAAMLSMKLGPDWFYSVSNIIGRNPSMNGWLLEMWFFSCLSHTGVELVDALGNTVETWPIASNVQNYSPGVAFDGWLKPLKWNQGGYDAVFIDKNGKVVRFVQVTRGDTHSFKIHLFYKFLKEFQNSSFAFEIETLEIFFLVDKDKLQNFDITPVQGQGLLEPFGAKWAKGKEADSVIKLGLKGWKSP